MLRKYFTILLLAIAQVIILGHGLVSHHHHTEVSGDGSQHHISKEDKHKHKDENPLEFAFSGLIHDGEYVSFTSSDETKIIILKSDLKSLKIFSIDFSPPAEYVATFKKYTFPLERDKIYKSPQNRAHKLRGPPSFIV